MTSKMYSTEFDQRGLTLIELMVAMIIGLVVVGAVMINYIGTGASSRQQSAYSQMAEDAQIALSMIARDVASAGYAEPMGTQVIGTTTVFVRSYAMGSPNQPMFGCSTPFGSPTTGASVSCDAAGSTLTHAIAVVYEANTQNTYVNSSGEPTDCLGMAIGTSVYPGTTYSYAIAKNRYFIRTAAGSTTPELYCSAAGGQSQGLVENVEQLLIWYGEALAAAPKQPVRFVKADSVVDWNNVVSVRLCIVMRSADAVLNREDKLAVSGGQLQYRNCDRNMITIDDGRARRAYYTTVSLRSRAAYN